MIDRRGFIRSSLLGLTGYGLLSSCASLESPVSEANVYVPNDKSSIKGRFLLVSSDPKIQGECRVSLFDWDTRETIPYPARIPMTVPHSIVQSRHDRNEVFVFEVYGKAAKVNLATGRVTSGGGADTESLSHGHGIQPANEELVFCTEMSSKSFHKHVSVRSTESMKVVDTVPVELGGHHIIQVPNTTLLVCSSPPRERGWSSELHFYDYKKKKIVRSLNFDFDVIHMTARPNGEVIGVGDRSLGTKTFKPSPTESSYRNSEAMFKSGEFFPAPGFVVDLDSKPRFLWDEKNKDLFKFGFGLSTTGNRILATYMKSDAVVVWRDTKIEKIISLPHPQLASFSKDGSEFMVVSASGLSIFSSTTFETLHTMNPAGGGRYLVIGAYT